MTSPALPATTERSSSAVATCAVCPHPVASHDAIGLRFCQATLNGAMSRGCVCPSS
ncbi:RGCVC family protein [Modestobacter marinus]|uniref:RGCVC family protein n=1 Tax=Modestobacter marinus TaxID=477641 RepID=UPI001C94F6C4|nr:RGCVC family protein [Modestobacter marinus]